MRCEAFGKVGNEPHDKHAQFSICSLSTLQVVPGWQFKFRHTVNIRASPNSLMAPPLHR